MTDPVLAPAGLVRILCWFSPTYPTGAYTYSHGLEYAVEAGLVGDRATLVRWVGHGIAHGAGAIDAGLLVASWRAAAAEDFARLAALAETAAAWKGTAETALETGQQGRAFLDTTRAAWADPRLDRLAREIGPRPIPLPIAVGAAAAWGGLPVGETCLAACHGWVANLVSAGVRLIPLGQTDGQRALADLAGPVQDAARRALTVPETDLGSAAPMVEWTSMRHETQYSRLFRS